MPSFSSWVIFKFAMLYALIQNMPGSRAFFRRTVTTREPLIQLRTGLRDPREDETNVINEQHTSRSLPILTTSESSCGGDDESR
jgi:hypothetical protein